MNVQRIFKKASILTICYIFLIFGIFIVQFKSGSIITEKFGNMKLSLSTQTLQDGTTELQNDVTVSFRGISFSASENTPIMATDAENSRRIPLTLVDWRRVNNSSCQLDFSENVQIVFSANDSAGNTWLDIQTYMPENISEISLPYFIASGFTAETENQSSILIHGKNATWSLSADEISDSNFMLTPSHAKAVYRLKTQTVSFAFENIPDLEMATKEKYVSSIEKFKSTLVSNLQEALRNNISSISEHETVAFIAAMAESGRYTEALNIIPQSLRNRSDKTYLSAPFFNSLSNTNMTLTAKMDSLATLVRTRSVSEPLYVLSADGIEDYVLANRNSQNIPVFLGRIIAAVEERESDGTLSLPEAINVLRLYNKLAMSNFPNVAQLENIARISAKTIESFSALEQDRVVVSENGVILSAFDTSRTADALIQYGNHSGNNAYARAGYLMLNSLFANVDSFERTLLAALYPVIVHDNTWYPHVSILDEESGSQIWAWTCAQDIRYIKNTDSVRIEIDFPDTFTHHIIFRNIQDFQDIYIYETRYRSDAHFETYNASGYIYQRETASLLVKSRHRSRTEIITLYRLPPTSTPEQPTPQE